MSQANKIILNDETLIDLTNDSVTPTSLAEGVTAHDASGASIVGQFPIVLDRGDSDNSIIQKGTGAQAITEGSIAFGLDSIAGAKGYYIRAISAEKNADGKAWLSLMPNAVHPEVLLKYSGENYKDLWREIPDLPYAVGDTFNVICGDHFLNVGTITALVPYTKITSWSDNSHGTFYKYNSDTNTYDEYISEDIIAVSLTPEEFNEIKSELDPYEEATGNPSSVIYFDGDLDLIWEELNNTVTEKNAVYFANYMNEAGSFYGPAYKLVNMSQDAYKDLDCRIEVTTKEEIEALPVKPWEFISSAGTDDYSFMVPKKPTLGIVEVATNTVAMGRDSISAGNYGFAEGRETIVAESYGHAEGRATFAGYCGHAEGWETAATGRYAYAGGRQTAAIGEGSHAEGRGTLDKATGEYTNGTALGYYSHVEGQYCVAKGTASHAGGSGSIAEGTSSFASGQEWNKHGPTTAKGVVSTAFGGSTQAIGEFSFTQGYGSQALGTGSHAEGAGVIAEGKASHAEGYYSKVISRNASDIHKEDNAAGAHAEGSYTKATNKGSHAEGSNTTSSGTGSHAEGESTTASNTGAHAEGAKCNFYGVAYTSIASAIGAHAEGSSTASETCAHSEGAGTVASGICAHAEGGTTIASGKCSHAGGLFTEATKPCQTVIGILNAASDNALFIVGNGTEAAPETINGKTDYSTVKERSTKSNAFEVHKNGRIALGAGSFGTEAPADLAENELFFVIE